MQTKEEIIKELKESYTLIIEKSNRKAEDVKKRQAIYKMTNTININAAISAELDLLKYHITATVFESFLKDLKRIEDAD